MSEKGPQPLEARSGQYPPAAEMGDVMDSIRREAASGESFQRIATVLYSQKEAVQALCQQLGLQCSEPEALPSQRSRGPTSARMIISKGAITSKEGTEGVQVA